MNKTKNTSIKRFSWTNVVFLLTILILGSSCHSTRNLLFDTPKAYERSEEAVVYINQDSTQIGNYYQHRIAVDDRIQVRFMNDIEFVSGLKSSGQGSGGILFLVDNNGNINLPLLGEYTVLGKTRQEVQDYLLIEYSKSFTNPSIEVQIVGLSVSVQGEVANPGIYELPREKTSLIEVIAAAGGVTQYGKQRVVKVARGTAQDQEPEIIIFDLTQIGAIETSEMILRDKDIVYVQPRAIRVFANALSPYSTFLSLLGSVSSIAVITYSLIRTP